MLFLIASAFALDTVDSHGFHLAPADGDLIDHVSTWTAEEHTPQTGNVSAVLEYAAEPLVLHFSNGASLPLVDSLAALNLGGFYAVTPNFSLAVQAPIYFTQDPARTGVGLGDLRLAAPVGLQVHSSNLALGVVPYLDIPGLYPTRAHLTSNGPTFGLIGAASLSDGNTWSLSTNLGLSLTPEINFYNLNGGPKLIANLAASHTLGEHVALGAEVVAHPSLYDNLVTGTESPIEAIGSIRGDIAKQVRWTAGLSAALSRGASAATWRAFGGISVALGHKRPTNEPPAVSPPITVDPPGVEVRDGKVFIIKPIFFDFDKADIRFPDSQDTLDKLIKVMQNHHEIHLLQISTGTDTRGGDEYNMRLSNDRAASVVTYLVENGISPNRLTSIGLGENALLEEDCIDETCHERNRYSLFTILE
jgi:outer membrane protein OmpA-like peptidoglycan-associated protein